MIYVQRSESENIRLVIQNKVKIISKWNIYRIFYIRLLDFWSDFCCPNTQYFAIPSFIKCGSDAGVFRTSIYVKRFDWSDISKGSTEFHDVNSSYC